MTIDYQLEQSISTNQSSESSRIVFNSTSLFLIINE